MDLLCSSEFRAHNGPNNLALHFATWTKVRMGSCPDPKSPCRPYFIRINGRIYSELWSGQQIPVLEYERTQFRPANQWERRRFFEKIITIWNDIWKIPHVSMSLFRRAQSLLIPRLDWIGRFAKTPNNPLKIILNEIKFDLRSETTRIRQNQTLNVLERMNNICLVSSALEYLGSGGATCCQFINKLTIATRVLRRWQQWRARSRQK